MTPTEPESGHSGTFAEVRVFPPELRPGDRYRIEDGSEWEVTHIPHVYRQGKRVSVRMQLLSDPRIKRAEDLATHEKVSVRRPAAG